MYLRISSRDHLRNSQQKSPLDKCWHGLHLHGGEQQLVLDVLAARLEGVLLLRPEPRVQVLYCRMNSRDYLRNSQQGSLLYTVALDAGLGTGDADLEELAARRPLTVRLRGVLGGSTAGIT